MFDKITLYGMNGSGPVMKVLLTLSELGLSYDYKQIDLVKGEQHQEPYKSLNPLSRVPTIVFNDGEFVLSESSAIVRYLVNKYEAYDLYPQNLEDRAVVDRWAGYFEQHVNLYVGKLAWNRKFAPAFGFPVNEEDISNSEERLQRPLDDIEGHLALNGSFYRGKAFTVADIAALPWMGFWQDAGLKLENYPMTLGWIERCQSRQSWKDLLGTLKSKN